MMPNAIAACASAYVNGPAIAIELSAVATAPARIAALKVDLVDMIIVPVGLHSARSLSAQRTVRSSRTLCYIFGVTRSCDPKTARLELNFLSHVTKDRLQS